MNSLKQENNPQCSTDKAMCIRISVDNDIHIKLRSFLKVLIYRYELHFLKIRGQEFVHTSSFLSQEQLQSQSLHSVVWISMINVFHAFYDGHVNDFYTE
jgi:hypothetical protein